jgi:hypothetical protein
VTYPNNKIAKGMRTKNTRKLPYIIKDEDLEYPSVDRDDVPFPYMVETTFDSFHDELVVMLCPNRIVVD